MLRAQHALRLRLRGPLGPQGRRQADESEEALF